LEGWASSRSARSTAVANVAKEGKEMEEAGGEAERTKQALRPRRTGRKKAAKETKKGDRARDE